MSVLPRETGDLAGGSRDPWTIKTLRPVDKWVEPLMESPAAQMVAVYPDYHYEFGTKATKGFADEYKLEDEHLNMDYFALALHGKKHTSYIGEDDAGGPVIVVLEDKEGEIAAENKFATRKVLIINQKETSRLLLPTVAKIRNKILLKQLRPDLATANLRKCRLASFPDDLLELEKKLMVTNYKFGLLYQKPGQTEEDQWYNNVDGSPELEEFLVFLGEKITLKGWTRFRGGLQDSRTGLHSIYTTVQKYEIMFHVSTYLPFYPADPQQIERKRHLGNDVVVIVFRDSAVTERFDPLKIKSQFNHVFVVVQVDPTKTERHYRIAFVSKNGVLPFGPLLPAGESFPKGEPLRKFLLHKLINAERAAIYAPDFQPKLWFAKKLLLQELVSKDVQKDGRKGRPKSSTKATVSKVGEMMAHFRSHSGSTPTLTASNSDVTDSADGDDNPLPKSPKKPSIPRAESKSTAEPKGSPAKESPAAAPANADMSTSPPPAGTTNPGFFKHLFSPRDRAVSVENLTPSHPKMMHSETVPQLKTDEKMAPTKEELKREKELQKEREKQLQREKELQKERDKAAEKERKKAEKKKGDDKQSLITADEKPEFVP